MTINRVLTLAAISVSIAALLYLSGHAHPELRKPRAFVAGIPNQPEAEVGLATKYFQEACPNIIVIKDQQRSDYRINALWRGGHWIVLVHRKDFPLLFTKQDSADAMETFRQSCTAIWEDARESADFDAHAERLPIGRYSLHSDNPSHILLLDTKTGAVWELKPQPLGDDQEFERISVEGLYNRKTFGP